MENFIPSGGDGWWGIIGVILGGGSVAGLVFKFAGKIVDRLMERAQLREIRKEDAATQLREELRQDITRCKAQVSTLEIQKAAGEVREDELQRKYNQLFHHSVEVEIENKLLRATHTRIRAYVIYQQEEIRKALGLPEMPVLGVPAWLDDEVPGPTSSEPKTPMSPTRDVGKDALDGS